jgi:hypothetical protein
MRVGMPHAGNLYIPFKAMFQKLGIDYIIPPVNNQRTLSLGVKHSPEGLCIPFKLTLGNLIEAAELGADTLLMIGGFGICRLGYYAKVQQQILHDLGYDVEMVQLGVSERKFFGLLGMIKRLSNNAPLPANCSSPGTSSLLRSEPPAIITAPALKSPSVVFTTFCSP